MKALILAAGLGTRLLPLTKDTPKCMIKVGGKPVLEHLVDHLNSFGITEIIVNLHHLPEKIYQHFGTRLLYFYEPKLLGEERTERELQNWLGESYIVMNGDTLTDVDIGKMIVLSSNEEAEILSVDDGVYTGTRVGRKWQGKILKVEFECYWVDIGTPEGLKKARDHYEKNKLNHLS